MVSKQQHRSLILQIISFLYIFLFSYAALSKILDFDNFQVQLAQSPLLSSFAGIISYSVPTTEIFIVILFLIPNLRRAALYLSFSLMVMFSTYIFIMLNFSPFLPCSCGGILDKMSWNQHLVFNLIFVALSIVGLSIKDPINSSNTKFLKTNGAILTILFVLSTTSIAILFTISEDMIHHRNNFTRRFPHHPASLKAQLDLGLNSYYIAGIANGKIYLGNYTSPLTMTVLDTALKNKEIKIITIPDVGKKYHAIKIAVKYPYFFMADGQTSFIYKGLVSDWKAKVWMENLAYFTLFEPLDEESGAIRALDSKTHQNVLGPISISNKSKVTINKQLLVKQIDGVFDTGGTMVYNAQLQKLIYTYSYRNEYLIIDNKLQNKIVGNTIDTTTHASIKVRYIPSLEGSKIASPSKLVNITTATYGSHLFVKAGLIGKFEPEEMWKEASIIDVYNIKDRSYFFSFYVHNIRDKKLRQFYVEKDKLFALIGNKIVSYEFEKEVLNNK